jgi:hypothetical protein
MKTARWTAAIVGGALVLLAILAGTGSRTEKLRTLVVQTLADRLDSEVELASFSVDTFPTVVIEGTGLVMRHKGRRDVPPLVTIGSFRIEGGMIGLFSRPRRFRTVALTGLQVNIPPGGFKSGAGTSSASAETKTDQPSGPAAIVIDKLVADDATLALIPRKAGKSPRVFAVHRLTMDGIGRGNPMEFKAEITNPLPKGLINTEGTFGPWRKSDPGETSLTGRYTFENVDLATVKGIGGTLTSAGTFTGRLDRIEVAGETKTPDFRVKAAGNPVPLRTKFQAVVDGTDGDTYLNNVDATFLNTSLNAKGAVVGQKGVKGRTVQVHVKITDGRIEDVLKLATKGSQPLLAGRLALHADLKLPPGPQDVLDRLELGGDFTVESGRFSDRAFQEKLAEMSERARGAKDNKPDAPVMTNLSGRFALTSGVLRLPNANFALPGAHVQVAGWYGLESQALEFDGTLRMQASVSKAVGTGGIKGALLKIADPIFRKDGAGAVIPIKIRGTRSEPKFGLDFGKVFK